MEGYQKVRSLVVCKTWRETQFRIAHWAYHPYCPDALDPSLSSCSWCSIPRPTLFHRLWECQHKNISLPHRAFMQVWIYPTPPHLNAVKQALVALFNLEKLHTIRSPLNASSLGGTALRNTRLPPRSSLICNLFAIWTGT